jgi:hypothetical protein
MAFLKKNEDYLKCHLEMTIPYRVHDSIIIVLINGCFDNGPDICPRLVMMAQGRLYWPEATLRVNTTFRGPL